MSVSAKNLTRIFGNQKAVDNLTFSVGKGEVVGFLGPNGAGKSTTMKMITGILAPTNGEASVCGFPVNQSKTDTRKFIGYLPENNPLYPEMFVHEYLEFSGGFYGLKGEPLRKRMAMLIETCGLAPEQNKKIQQLSRGYRQRVGLAQAMLHDPEVLILDEPTSGLDPNQLADIRALIRTVSANKTVLFSTHIMQEVEAICDRALVIHEGKLVADDTIKNLTGSSGTCLLAEFATDIAIEELMLPDGTAPEKFGERMYRYQASGADIRSSVFRLAAEKNLPLIGLKEESSSIEQVFRKLTSSSKNDPDGQS